MAAFKSNPVRTMHPVELITFQLDGEATPVIATNGNRMGCLDESVAIVDNGAGDYTVTLREDYHDVWPINVMVETAAGNHLGTCIPAAAGTSPMTLQILTYDTDATAALADTTSIITVTALGFMNSGGT